jgi:hypothetical protein
MVNPLLTVLFDLLLIGTAGSVVAAMVTEYLANREPAVGTTRARARVARTGMYARGRTPVHARRHAPVQTARGWQA